MIDAPPGRAALDRTTVTRFGIAAGPIAIVGLPFTIYLPPYIAEGGVIPVALVGTMFALCTLWDGLVDPAIGTLIDKVRIGHAPHRRWMVMGAAPMLVLLTLIVTIGDTLPIYLLLPLMLIFYSSNSLYDVAHLAWGSALARNPDDSARLFGARDWSGKWVLIAAFAAPALAQLLIPGLSLQGRIIAYASLCLVALPLALIMIAKLRPGRTVSVETTSGIGWRAEIAATLSYRPLVLVTLIQFLNAFAFGSLTALFVFYADGVLGLDDRSSVLLFATFIGGAIFTPFWIWAARKFGKAQTMIGMGLWLIIVLMSANFISSNNIIHAAIFSTVLGSGFVGLLFIHGLIADLTPQDTQRCGRDRTGFLFAILHVLQKAGTASAIAVSYIALDLIGFDANDASASAGDILTLFTGLPALAWVAMIGLLFVFLRQPALALAAESH
jgi:glycoside/pentoside/hexuronide:cation symporter, GPH family